MPVPLQVFCCYAREDQKMLDELKTHLTPLQKSGQITIWSDTNLNAGVEWKKELHQHSESANIILLLISPNFLASDACEAEMKRAIERHDQGSTHVIPILLRPVHWDNTPVARFQIVPTNTIPIIDWPHRDAAFYDVVAYIRRFLSGSPKPPLFDEVLKQLPTRQPDTTLHHHVSNTPIEGVLQSTQASTLPPQISPITSAATQKAHSLPSLPLGSRPEAITLLRLFAGHAGDILNMVLSADGERLVSWSRDETLRLWDVQTGQCFSILDKSPTARWRGGQPCSEIALSGDGNILAYLFGNERRPTIKIRNIQSDPSIHDSIGIDGSVVGLALDVNGHFLFVGKQDGIIDVWKIKKPRCECLGPFNNNHLWKGRSSRSSRDNMMTSLTLGADGRILVSGYQDGTIALWNVGNRECSHVFDAHVEAIANISLSTDGNTLATCGNSDQRERIRRDKLNKEQTRLWTVRGDRAFALHAPRYESERVALDAKGLVLAIINPHGMDWRSKTIDLLSIQTGQSLHTLPLLVDALSRSPFQAEPSCLALSADGRVLARGDRDGTITLWGIQP